MGDSESDECWSFENECDEDPMEAKSKRCIIDISTMSKCQGKSLRRVETELTMALSETDSVYDDASFHNASFDIVPSGCVDNSTDCDDEDGCEIRSEIERFELLAKKVTKFSPEWFELKEELVELNVLLNSYVKEEDHQHTKPLEACVSNQSSQRLLSHMKVDEIFLTPIYFSALLVAMAHEPSKRGARFCGTYKCSDCEEVEPML